MKRVLSLVLILMLSIAFAHAEALESDPRPDDDRQSESDSGVNGSDIQPFVYGGHTYMLYTSPNDSWKDMRDHCVSMGGYLACITDPEENAALSGYVSGTDFEAVYFGLYCDKTGHWHWLNGTPVDYAPWADGEPSSGWKEEPYGCYSRSLEDGQWNDGSGKGGYFLCEWDTISPKIFKTAVSPFDPLVFEGHTYLLYPNANLSWKDMKDRCAAMGGYLACITSDSENSALYEYVSASDFEVIYFGLYCDEKNHWHWLNKEPLDYTAWDSGEPNGGWGKEPFGCYFRPIGSSKWNDSDGKGGYYLCEWDADISETIKSAAEKAYSEYATLENGSKGDEVKALQQRLVDLDWLDGGVDGDFGNKTKTAVELFQRSAGLPVTGIADGLTQSVLFSDGAPKYEVHIEWTGTSSVSGVTIGGAYEITRCFFNVDGQEYVLENNETKTVKTPGGTYKLYPSGKYEKIG